MRHTVGNWLGRGAAGVFALQVATAVGLTTVDAVQRRNRKPYRFPTADPLPVEAGRDRVTIYTFGRDLYEDMLADIGRATDHIYFETYIWKGDEFGQRFKDALIAAAERGVRVCVVYDEFANLVVPRSFFRFPPSVLVQSHPVVASAVPTPRHIGRDHRKLLVVDDISAYIGGYNIGDTYADRWRDTHARLQGPGVAEIENAFVDYWNLRHVGILASKKDSHVELQQTGNRSWETKVWVHRNTPKVSVYPIRNMYLEAIDRATERIWMTQAYLIPDDDLTHQLFMAAKRGVDVRIIVPAQSNHVVADWLSRGFYDALLASGVRLFLYQGAMVHAKTCTIDGHWSTIGTANLDRLSLAGNYEVNAEFLDQSLAARMEEIWRIDEANCIELTAETWRRRSRLTKFTERLLSPWRPLF